MTAEYYGWHFSEGKEAHGRHRKIVAGRSHSVRGPVVLCKHGLHAAARPLDALSYGLGPIVARVRLTGEVILDNDKAAARKREYLAVADATNTLHEFACWCADEALLREREHGREPDQRSWAAIETKRRWLRGEATSAELAAARDAAWDSAWASARDSAWASAWDKQNQKLEEVLLRLPGMSEALEEVSA